MRTDQCERRIETMMRQRKCGTGKITYHSRQRTSTLMGPCRRTANGTDISDGAPVGYARHQPRRLPGRFGRVTTAVPNETDDLLPPTQAAELLVIGKCQRQ